MDYSDLHRLVDQVPRHSLHLIARLVEAVLSEEDPVTRALDNAPEDDEPITKEDLRDLDEAMGAAREGDLVSDEDLWTRLDSEGRL
ncbi:MAG: hypothetical protein ACOX9B_03820 [Candidatus Xenobium sp.]|jgi:hypothetical protein|nr:hypothetical protein [Burkholderiales bacterium]